MKNIKEFMVPMRDGIKLYTRVFCPEEEGPWPTVVIRDPYGKANPAMVTAAAEFTQRGYATVLQHVRGTAGSEGEWVPHKNERQDGIDALNWVAKQPWMDGNIGMFGISYRGYVQLAIADQVPPEVKTMVVGALWVGSLQTNVSGWHVQNRSYYLLGHSQLRHQAGSQWANCIKKHSLFVHTLIWIRNFMGSSFPGIESL